MTTYYKFLTSDNLGEYSGFDYTEYLPKRGKPGAWLPKIEEIELCARGYHACLKSEIMNWANDNLYIVELRGKKEKDDDKTVAQEMRFIKKVTGWNEKNLRLPRPRRDGGRMNWFYCDNCKHHLSPYDYASFGSWSYVCPDCGFIYLHGYGTPEEQVKKFNKEAE